MDHDAHMFRAELSAAAAIVRPTFSCNYIDRRRNTDSDSRILLSFILAVDEAGKEDIKQLDEALLLRVFEPQPNRARKRTEPHRVDDPAQGAFANIFVRVFTKLINSQCVIDMV